MTRPRAAPARPPSPFLPLVLVLLAAPAFAQEARPERLYLGTGVLVGSNRLVALSGAYTGIAEGIDGFTTNFAALAHRNPRRESFFDFNLGLTGFTKFNPQGRDLDNDGESDGATALQDLFLGGLVQLGRFGFGLYGRASIADFCLREPCGPADTVTVRRQFSGLGAGLAVFKDQLVFGLGFLNGSAEFSLPGQRPWTDSGLGWEAGVLVRPHAYPFRIGAAFRPMQTRDLRLEPGQVAEVIDRRLFAGSVAPALLSVGGSFRLGEGNHRYNRLSKMAFGDIPVVPGEARPAPDVDHDTPAGRFLVAVQADLIFPVGGATSLAPFTHRVEPEAVGGRLQVVPRLGVEHDTVVKRLRLRGGSYLEPSPFEGRGPRAHLTFGFELLLFHFLDDWTLSGGVDLAARYQNLGVGIGFWR